MNSFKKIIATIVLLTPFSTIFAARYYITNNGTKTVNVKLDIVERDEFEEIYKYTLPANNIKHGQSVEVDTKGGGRYANVIYLLQEGSGNLPLIPVTNGMNNTGDKRGKFTQSLDDGDYTIIISSQPDPKKPDALLWTINAKQR